MCVVLYRPVRFDKNIGEAVVGCRNKLLSSEAARLAQWVRGGKFSLLCRRNAIAVVAVGVAIVWGLIDRF